MSSIGNVSWDIYRVLQNENNKSRYLTPCCGLDVQNPTQTLKSANGSSNTFDISPSGKELYPSFGNFSWDIYKPPPIKNPNIKVDI